MKDKWDVVKSKPLADFMPTILLKAKDFATEITIYNNLFFRRQIFRGDAS
jgi:DNA-damage-inducible protein D